MNNDFFLRIKDVILCLSSANAHQVSLGRLEMQKIIYLVDSMSAYLFVLSGNKAHKTYYYGPYDTNIQNAIDALLVRGFINASNIKISNDTISCDYFLTKSGLIWKDKILNDFKSIKYRQQIVNGILYSLVKRNLLNKVKDLVYAEPMYVEAKEHGYYFDLMFSPDNAGHSYLSLIEKYLKYDNNQIDIQFSTDMYIDYLYLRCCKLSGEKEIEGFFDVV